MGLLMMSPKFSKFKTVDISFLRGFKDNNMDSQVFVFRIPKIYLKIAFVYIRPGKATKLLFRNLFQNFDCHNCDILLGDLNLNPREIADNNT